MALLRLEAQVAATSGSCLIRNSSSSLNGAVAPLIGDGFAKTMVKANNQILQIVDLQGLCTDTIFDVLLTEYCKYNTQPVQRQVVIYGATTGNVQSSACAAQGCSFVSCP